MSPKTSPEKNVICHLVIVAVIEEAIAADAAARNALDVLGGDERKMSRRPFVVAIVVVAGRNKKFVRRSLAAIGIRGRVVQRLNVQGPTFNEESGTIVYCCLERWTLKIETLELYCRWERSGESLPI